MNLETIADVKLTGRALAAGWLDGCDERRKAAVNSLFDVVENSADPELRVKAFEALIRADQADIKREEVAIRKQEADDAKRLRLIEILGSLSPAELSKITSCNTGPGDRDRAGE